MLRFEIKQNYVKMLIKTKQGRKKPEKKRNNKEMQ